MGRSSGYCFKIIACGGSSESVDRDDLDASSENKGSDKRGWSFRKRSAGHRVLSNTVIREIPSFENKISEPVIINSEAPVSSSVSEKTSANQWTEELLGESTSTTKGGIVSNFVTKAADEDHIKFDSSPDESFVIVIQAAVRKFLAQRELLRHKNVVKLQAAVRGHLVRCQAAGTLRCIQAIVRMQVLVRARHANLSVQRSSTGKKGTQDSSTKPHPTYISIEKLLSNRFASQLLESTPRTKQINIKCDSSKNDSAWKWLERWTSVSSPEVLESHAPPEEKHDNIDDTKNQVGNTMNSEQNSYIVSHDEKPQALNTTAPDSKKSDFLSDQIGPTLFPEQKRVATEQVDSEGRKSVFGSRKASNPSFIAAHSRFEELTSKTNSLKSLSSSNQEHIEPTEPLVYQGLTTVQTGTSECGTELSITSMFDSPDPSDVGNIEESEKETKVFDKGEHTLLGTELTHSILAYDSNNGADTDIHHQVDIKSPEASPRSQLTAPECQTTPSSQISNNNKTKIDKKVSGQKSKSLSNSKKSPISSNVNSSLRSSLEQLPRDSKPGKRRNSLGSQSSDYIDQEPRDSSSSIPSYMQVTESARAKALANSSPRLSPDTQGKEAYMKKRHSLPASGNGRHGSPRIKRSSPQAQQTTKGNDNRERKWQT